MGSSHRKRLTRLAPVVFVALLAVTAAACAPPGSPSGNVTSDVAASVNQDRATSGLRALAWDNQLASYAQSWANHLATTGTLTHTDLGALMRLPWMSAWWTLGENLLQGPGAMSAAAAENLWMNSAGHRADILNPSFTHIGVAAAWDGAGRLWLVAEFGAR
jgi:uncharacterized protein YkwD